MKQLLLILALFSSAVYAATEQVTVSWTPAVQDQGVVITQFVIYYEDSTGTQFEVPVPPTETQKELQVELGPAEFYMRAFDDAVGSEPSETVLFDVVPKVIQPPGTERSLNKRRQHIDWIRRGFRRY